MFKVVDLIVEDMKRYKPSVLLIPQYIDPKTDKPAKNYYNFLIQHEGFSEALGNYEF